MEAAIEVDLHLCYSSPRARAVDAKAVRALVASIEESGLMQPITVRRVRKSRSGQMCDAFEIIAGLHRVKAFRQLQRQTIPAIVLDVDDLHAELMLIDENLCRNDLTPAERAAAVARRKAIYIELHPTTKHGGNLEGAGVANLATPDEPRFTKATADATGQSERSVRRESHRGEALGEDVLAKVARTSLDKCEELDALAKLEPEARDALIERAANGEKVSAKIIAKQQLRANREVLLGATQCALPTRKFGVILADPEWRFEPWSRATGMDRAADNHYPTSCTEVIAARNVPSIAADDCALFLWATVPMLPHALCVMAAWGFDYKSHFVWAKDRIGTGYWNRNKHELLLLGVCGKIPAPAPGTQWESVIEAAVGEHSAKPEKFLELIEFYFPTLPKIELNRRGPPRPGWSAWGNELEHDPITGEIPIGAEKSLARYVGDETASRVDPACPEAPASDPPGAGALWPHEQPLELPAFLDRSRPD